MLMMDKKSVLLGGFQVLLKPQLALEMGFDVLLLGEGGREGARNAHDTPHSISFISLAKPAFGCAQSFILDCGRGGEDGGFVRSGFERSEMEENFVQESK